MADRAPVHTPARRVDWLFFDVGETLLQLRTPTDRYAELFAQHGARIAPAEATAIVERAQLEALAPDHVGPPPDFLVDPVRAAARWRRFAERVVALAGLGRARTACAEALLASFCRPEWFPLYPDARSALEQLLRAGYRLGVVSNWEARLPALLAGHGLADLFEFVFASEAEGVAKPGLDLFRRALARADARPDRALLVGDSLEHDVRPAAALGLVAVLLDRGGYYRPGTWQPTIRGLGELPGLLADGA